MTARAGMADLITQLRGLCNAGTADYTIAGTTYWTDDQLQAILDRNRVDLYQEPLVIVDEWGESGTVETKNYYAAGWEWFESGTNFYIEDAAGNNAGTATYTADYNTGHIAFTTDQDGKDYYLTGRSYDLNGAAADVWRQKASQVASTSYGMDWSSDNHSVRRSQSVSQAREMANYYAGLARPKVGYIVRSDNAK